MTSSNSLNIKLSNSQPNKLSSVIENEIEVVLRLASNIRENMMACLFSVHNTISLSRHVLNDDVIIYGIIIEYDL